MTKKPNIFYANKMKKKLMLTKFSIKNKNYSIIVTTQFFVFF